MGTLYLSLVYGYSGETKNEDYIKLVVTVVNRVPLKNSFDPSVEMKSAMDSAIVAARSRMEYQLRENATDEDDIKFILERVNVMSHSYVVIS